MGAHVQVGPTVGYSFKTWPDHRLGSGRWKRRISASQHGGTYRLEPAPEPEGPEAEAARPVRSRAGKPSAAVTDGSSDAEATPGTPASEDEGASPDANSEPEPGFLLSGAVGLRYMGGEWEAYFTPKAVVLWCVEYAS